VELNNLNEPINKTIIDIEPKPVLIGATPNGNGQMQGQGDVQVRMLLDELQFSRQMILTMLQNKGNGHESTPVAELIAGMQGLHALSSQKDPVELILKGMELGNKNGSSPDWKSELLNTVKEVAVPALNAISKMRPNPVSSGQVNVPSSVAELPPADQMKQALTWLKSKILKGFDPGLAVDWITQNADEPQYMPILTMAVRGSIDNFIELDAELGNEPFRSWFVKAIQMLKDWYAEQSNDSTDMDGGTGNHSDASNDAGSRARKPKIVKAV
jgi:hypothetical protein